MIINMIKNYALDQKFKNGFRMVNNAINIVQNGQEWHQRGHGTAQKVQHEQKIKNLNIIKNHVFDQKFKNGIRMVNNVINIVENGQEWHY